MKKQSFALLVLLCINLQTVFAQHHQVTLSGSVKEAQTSTVLSFVQVSLRQLKDSAFVAGTVSGEDGRFTLPDIANGNYILSLSYLGFQPVQQSVRVGQLSAFQDLGNILLTPDEKMLQEVSVTARQEVIAAKMDKKTFTVADNVSQAGSSVLEAMKNLPGITTSQDGKVQLRGSDKVMILVDGKQTALTGIGGQSGLIGELSIDHDVDLVRERIDLGVRDDLEIVRMRDVAQGKKALPDGFHIFPASCAEENDMTDQPGLPRTSRHGLLARPHPDSRISDSAGFFRQQARRVNLFRPIAPPHPRDECAQPVT